MSGVLARVRRPGVAPGLPLLQVGCGAQGEAVREILWIVIGALSAYIVWQLWRVKILRKAERTYWDPPREPFQTTLDTSALRQEVAGLREELSQQRSALMALSQANDALQEQVTTLAAAQGVSPEYNEALVCARRGLDAGAIAERCSISVAEAELIRSLAERQGQADEEPR